MQISWDNGTQEKFKQLVAKMPVFMRPIAERALIDRAENIVKKDNRSEITEKDMVDAFFIETPFGFQGMMKNDLNSVGIDFTKYGYQK
ncbi:MAG TPA: hypothetical protein DCL35_07610 [Candidatus Omnitrophica bacterium]|nr:hypothetical protein [Candidatus Omnitrophota bacterium]